MTDTQTSPISTSISIVTFYFFKMFDQPVDEVSEWLYKNGAELNLRGIMILAEEGLNSTMSGERKALETFISRIEKEFHTGSLVTKWSSADSVPFRRLKVKRRAEIVTTTTPEMTVTNMLENNHLTPEEWNEVLKNEEDVFLVDTRNWYETRVGTFKGAVDPNIEKFTDFPKFIESQQLPKDQKILMFCTGGIRCEKGILELQKQGYDNVYQLEGGILNYLQKFPNDQWEGECFVFDHRVAVDQDLKPSQKFGLCPHTGQPGDIDITCVRCGHETKLSPEAIAFKDERSVTCSKNCAHHWKERPGIKGPRQVLDYDIPPQIAETERVEGEPTSGRR